MTNKDSDIIKGKGASFESKSWQEYVVSSKQSEPERQEEAAKFLSGMISICLTIILTIGENAFINSDRPIFIIAVLIVWLVSLIFSFSVLFPKRYSFSLKNIDSIKSTHEKIVKVKKLRLILSTVFFCIGLIFLIVIFALKSLLS